MFLRLETIMIEEEAKVKKGEAMAGGIPERMYVSPCANQSRWQVLSRVTAPSFAMP
jgi:hypothetical protein